MTRHSVVLGSVMVAVTPGTFTPAAKPATVDAARPATVDFVLAR